MISHLPVRATYDCHGDADAPVILLAHGMRLSRAMWTPQFGALARDARVVAPDLPRHGVLTDLPFTLDTVVEHLRRVIDDVGGRAMVVGLSLGAHASVALAHRYPERVAGLALAGCSLIFGSARLPYRLGAGLFEGLPEPLLRRVTAQYFRATYPPAVAQPIIDGGFSFRGASETLAVVLEHDYPALLRDYAGPVILLNGEEDRPARDAERAFLAANPRIVTQVIPYAGHLANLDQPAAFSDAVRGFARRIGWVAGPARVSLDTDDRGTR